MTTNPPSLSSSESQHLSYLRSLAIIVIVFGHVGGFWAAQPYSSYLHVFVPLFFFISGAVSYISFSRQPIIKNYYIKRLINLAIPYYLLCMVALLVYVINNMNFPEINLSKLNHWLQIRPIKDTRPFPVGQVWFLNTLIFITAFSPLYFVLIKKHLKILSVFIICLLTLSYAGQVSPESTEIKFFGNDINKPLIHSIFFIFGAYFFTIKPTKRIRFATLLLILCFILSCIMVALGVNLNLSKHNFPPTLYYVFISLIAICGCILLKDIFLWIIAKNNVLTWFFTFCHKHTFSIFILHTLVIYLVEQLNLLSFLIEKSISYGLVKFALVMTITCLMSPAFSTLSSLITRRMLKRFLS